MCKLEKYGNCDEETKNQEYCIFHKPNKNEVESREFYKKFLNRYKPRKERIYDEFGETERFVFEERLDCRGYVFPNIPIDVDFSFSRAVFERNSDFSGSKFEDAYFVLAEFNYVSSFRGVKFEFANFNKTKFNEKADFGGAEFKDAYFIGAVFRGDAYFGRTIFERAAYFTGEPRSEGYRFYGKLEFPNAEFQRGVNIDIPSEFFRLPEAEAEACRIQRLSYEKEGKKDDADRMFVRERRAIRRAVVKRAKKELKHSKNTKSKLGAMFGLIKAWISSVIEWFLADLTCEYGTNWKRPILLWLIVVLGNSLIYWLTHSVPNAYDFWSNLYFSIVTATTLGYGDLHPVGWGRALASAEAIFGTFMWAVLLVVFARKYMR